ncbi:MAG: hypothetical protein EBT03_13485, partial [Betaproteobacteria bacterium]|nr:hypothetical protein [Betaproteobacteria bacterium]
LGLPILEAQYCGCRVMVRDKPPMINLAGPGSGVVPEDAAEAGAVLAGMMAEPFDHAALQKWAQTRFSLRHVQEVLGGVIEQSDGNHSAVVLPLPGQRFSQALRAEGVT